MMKWHLDLCTFIKQGFLKILVILTFTRPWANLADDKFMFVCCLFFFFFFFSEDRIRHFMQNFSIGDNLLKCQILFGDNLHKVSNPVFLDK